jgi:hypothetical protein
MFAASTVEKRSGAESLRPATKKSALPRSDRATHSPVATSAPE